MSQKLPGRVTVMKFLGKGVTSQSVGSDEVPQGLVLGLISPVIFHSRDWDQNILEGGMVGSKTQGFFSN